MQNDFGLVQNSFFMWFARFQILIGEPQSIWRKLFVLSWLYQYGFIFSFKIHMLLLIFVSSFCVIENSSYSVFLLMAINHQVCFTKVRKSSFPCGQLWCVLSTPFGVPFHLPVLFLNDYSNRVNILKSCWIICFQISSQSFQTICTYNISKNEE